MCVVRRPFQGPLLLAQLAIVVKALLPHRAPLRCAHMHLRATPVRIPPLASPPVPSPPQVFLSRLLPLRMPTSAAGLEEEDQTSALQRYSVPVPKTGTVEALKAKLSQLSGIPTDQLLVADVFKGRWVPQPCFL